MEATLTRQPARRSVLAGNTVLAFLVLGLSNAIIGPSLPWLAQHWGVALADAGVLFTAQFGGACVTVILAGATLDRLGRKPLLVGGLVGMAAGLLGLAFAPNLVVAAVCAALFGLGFGALDVTLNIFIADLYPTARAMALNLTNGIFGLGALAGPLLVSAALQGNGAPAPVLWGAAAGVALIAGLYGVLSFPPHLDETQEAAPAGSGLAVLRHGYVLATAAMFFLYVGLEVGVGAWLFSFAQQGAALATDVAAGVVSTYWLAFTLGRLGAGVLAGRVPGTVLVWGGALLGAVGAATLAVLPGSAAALFAGAALCGLGFAPIFPTAFGLATVRYPATAGAVSSVLVLGGSLGGAVLPYAIGRLLAAGGVPLAAGSIAACALAVAAIQLLVMRKA